MRKMGEVRQNALRAKWPFIFTAATAAALFVYAGFESAGMTGSGTDVGIAYGVVGLAAALFLSAYRIRRVIYTWKAGSLEAWRQAHVYVGLFCVIVVLAHVGFSVDGLFSWILMGLFFALALGGVAGSILYLMAPLALSRYGIEALNLDQNIKGRAHFLARADDLAGRGSDEFREYYKDRVRPFFASGWSALRYLSRDEMSVAEKCDRVFAGLSAEAPAEDRHMVGALRALYMEREKTAFQRSRLQAMRWWLYLHGPVNAAFLATLAVHLVVVAYY